jgi:Zn-dependent protease with chaperone function
LTSHFEPIRADRTGPPEDLNVPANYFDGTRSGSLPVVVTMQAGEIVVFGVGVDRRAPWSSVTVTEPLGSTPRLIRFPDGAFCEVTDVAALARLLAAHGHHPGRVTQWEGSLRWITICGIVLLALAVVGYRYGLPAAAVVAADYVPEKFVELTSQETLKLLDGVLAPSALDEARRKRLIERFKQLRWPEGDGHRYDILFRKNDALGPNAMALPSGTVIVTDALVNLAATDEEIVAVLAHEAGHVEHRHGLRLVFQNSVVALAFTWLVGDMSTLLAAAPTALLQAKYSRDLERDADAYAVALLRINDISTEHFAKMLERIETSVTNDGPRIGVAVLDYLSSHPVTRERLEAVRQATR